MTMKLTKHQQEMLDGKQGDDDLFETPPRTLPFLLGSIVVRSCRVRSSAQRR